MANKTPQSTLTPLTDEEVNKLALKILRNEVFTDRHIAPGDGHLFTMIFMVFSFMDKKERLHMQRKSRPGLIYASMEHAGPRAINGYPMFFEATMISEADADKVWAEYRRLEKALAPDTV